MWDIFCLFMILPISVFIAIIELTLMLFIFQKAWEIADKVYNFLRYKVRR